MDRQRKSAIITGIALAGIALAIYLVTILKYLT
jgi:hypothetical protein